MSTIQELYQRNKNESSPETLDKLIMSTAKQSCKTTVVRKNSKLLYALPTAAVLVFGLSMIINLQNENQAIKTLPTSMDAELPKKEAIVKKETPKRKRQPLLAKMVQEIEQPLPVAPTPQIEEEQKSKTQQNFSETREETKTQGALAKYSIATEESSNTNNLQFRKKIKQNVSENISVEGFANSVADILKDNKPETNKDRKSQKQSSELLVDINKLEQLIKQQNLKEAKEFLIVLKQRYPDYDFTAYLQDD